MEETDQTVYCPVPVSNSRNDPILSSGAETRCHRRPSVHAEVGDRCGVRESRAVGTQMGSTDNVQPVGSTLLPPLNLHGHLWPVVAAAVVTERL